MPYLINVRVPVLVVLGLGCRAVDPGEEGGLGEVHQSWVQTKRLSDNFLDSPTHISTGDKQTQYDRLKAPTLFLQTELFMTGVHR